MTLFNWEDFKQFNVPPETLARYCNNLLQERTYPIKLCQKYHDLIRADAGFIKEVMDSYPNSGRMIINWDKK